MINLQNVQEKVIVLLGETGVGKSSLGNAILMKKVFPEYSSIDSETKNVKQSRGHLLNDSRNTPLILIDTPGFNDSNGRDRKHINDILYEIKKFKSVHAFLLVINSTCVRLNEGANEMLSLYDKMFPDFWKNCIIVLNHWSSSQEARRIRELQRPNQDLLTLDEEVRKKIIIDFKNRVRVVKLNSISRQWPIYSEEYKDLITQIRNMDDIWCKEMDEYYTEKTCYVQKQYDVLQDTLNMLIKKDLEKEDFISNLIYENNELKRKRARKPHGENVTVKAFLESISIEYLRKLCKEKIKKNSNKQLIIESVMKNFNSAQAENIFKEMHLDEIKYMLNKIKIPATGPKSNLISILMDHIIF